MGSQVEMKRRVVFDTTTVLSALLFQNGRLAWLRQHWREEVCLPLVSRATAAELTKVLAYSKFRLSVEDRRELLAEYLPYCRIVEANRRCPVVCRDAKDQPLLDLAQSSKADVLVSGDRDLLVLAGKTSFFIVSPEEYRREQLS
jgi:putative PIN family toxin of toxin-antitoxin system